MSKNNFDVIVVGANLTGFLIYQKLKKQDIHVGLVETSYSDKGFHLDPNPLKIGHRFTDINHIPFKQSHLELLNWLEEEKPLLWNKKEQTLLTFESGDFIPFVGFGDKTATTIDLLDDYNSANCFVSETFNSLIENEESTSINESSFIANSTLTDIEVENKKVKSITLNGHQVKTANQFIFTESPKQLAQILPSHCWNRKLLTKINKTTHWTMVQLNFEHSSKLNTNLDSAYMLMGTKKDSEPCLGQFHFNNQNNSETSKWFTLIDSELTDSVEDIHNSIKYLKKQIKRAFPSFFDTVVAEKILIEADTFGYFDFTEKEEETLNSLENLKLSSPLLSKGTLFLRSLNEAKKAVDDYIKKQSAFQWNNPTLNNTKEPHLDA